MIGYLKGKIIDLSPELALIVSTSGVGFEVYISGSAYEKLYGKTEGEVYTYTQVKEDGITLFGFSSQEEKSMFLKLISVSGVGPKMGIAVLSSLSAADVATAIATNDVKRLSAVKGMGKKTAERIILELREKVSVTELPARGGEVPATVSTGGDDDAIVALMTLGFTRSESEKAVARAKQNGATEIEDVIRFALQTM